MNVQEENKINITDRNNLVGFGKHCLKAEWFLYTILLNMTVKEIEFNPIQPIFVYLI